VLVFEWNGVLLDGVNASKQGKLNVCFWSKSRCKGMAQSQPSEILFLLSMG